VHDHISYAVNLLMYASVSSGAGSAHDTHAQME
jgi:hypothetical protein